MNYRIYPVFYVFLCLAITTACVAPEAENFKSLHLSQPKVLQVSPPSNTVLNHPIQISVNFSQRLDIETIHEHSIFLLSETMMEPYLNDVSELLDDILDDKMDLPRLRFELMGDEQTLTIHAEDLTAEGVYFLVITPLLKSVTGVPFNQKPGSGPEPFLARYGFGDSINLSHDGSLADQPQPAPIPGPDFLVINEILYDGRDSETDGEAFVELYGTPQTNISGFEIHFINGSNGEITDSITLPDGSLIPESGIWVVADLRTHSTSESRVANFHHLDQFDPQNGPDAVMLQDPTGQIWDALCYGEGAVTDTPAGQALGEGLPALDAGAGHSLSRSDGIDTEDNARDFIIFEAPSPGTL